MGERRDSVATRGNIRGRAWGGGGGEGERIKYEGMGDSGAGEGGRVWTRVLFVEDEQGEGIGIDVLHTFLFGEGEGVQGNDGVTAQELLVGATCVLVYQLMNFHGCRSRTLYIYIN
ncbi:hypothetical protein F2P56_017350 [Juglans regia]|uniref:Uncharacterized protein n=1 Tax=Juglans regia TaxID=51240 RepID=A0A833XJX9_JUGRE|nr:hypothetical protein F2P56_017350 [Juglans regia]